MGVRFGTYTTPAAETESTSATGWNAVVVTEDFGVNKGDSYITGVVFDDAVVDDQFYSIGEGLGDVEVRATNQTSGQQFFTTTGPSGGFALRVPDGSYHVVATGSELPNGFVAADVVVAGENIKLDVDTSNLLESHDAFDNQVGSAKNNDAPSCRIGCATEHGADGHARRRFDYGRCGARGS